MATKPRPSIGGMRERVTYAVDDYVQMLLMPDIRRRFKSKDDKAKMKKFRKLQKKRGVR